MLDFCYVFVCNSCPHDINGLVVIEYYVPVSEWDVACSLMLCEGREMELLISLKILCKLLKCEMNILACIN
jgi:hypothetical protein